MFTAIRKFKIMTDISNMHKDAKLHTYWDDLVGGNTAEYKENCIDELLKSHSPLNVQKIIDIGCGTCDLIFRLQDFFGAKSLTLMDYDQKVIDELKEKYPHKDVNWVTEDVFELSKWNEKFDMIFLLDMIHEIYSFYGRPDRNIDLSVDHDLGSKYVVDLLKNAAKICAKGGGIVITDNLLTNENTEATVRIKNQKVIDTVKYFLENYITKNIQVEWVGNDTIKINSRDFCTLLTQYNKIKSENWDRWGVEKMETHQYLSLDEYKKVFNDLGFTLHAITGTPDDAQKEWNEDFEVVSGLSGIPAKRITLLAINDKDL